jgi:Flp pilus assembly CpaE family ATPase
MPKRKRNNGDGQQPVILRPPTDEDDETLTLVVGFRNYANLENLRRGLSEYNRRLREEDAPGRPWHIVGAQQNAQWAYEEAISSKVDLVLLNPMMEGYHHGLIQKLILFTSKPIPVIGMVIDRSDLGREMITNGAAGKIRIPINDASVATFLSKAEEAVNQAWRDRAQGRVQYTTNEMAGADDLSYERKTIAVWVPKGGGSTRTTIATNLAVALSHVDLGAKSTILMDLDMTKGDCHTLLGFTTNQAESKRYEMPLLRSDLHTLVVKVVGDYDRLGSNAINAIQVNSVLTNWREKESHLMLLPGLTSTAQAAAQEFRNMGLLYNIAYKLIQTLQNRATFVVLDLGQDFTRPFHRAALTIADEVLVPVPPIRTAILDTKNALEPLRHMMKGNLDKFSLVITAFDEAFGWGEDEIAAALQPLTKVSTTIPFDAQTANMALNTGEPIVLMDRNGPLGSSLIRLAGLFYPGLSGTKKKKNIFKKAESFMFKGA